MDIQRAGLSPDITFRLSLSKTQPCKSGIFLNAKVLYNADVKFQLKFVFGIAGENCTQKMSIT